MSNQRLAWVPLACHKLNNLPFAEHPMDLGGTYRRETPKADDGQAKACPTLFVAKSVDGVDAGGFYGGVDSEDDSDDD
jgi:hypothetical protein